MERLQVLFEGVLDRFRDPPPSLPRMDLNVPQADQNPLMIQFFEWNSRGTEELSWWLHFAREAPNLASMGFTQVWLPPPNKGMEKEGRGYDAYDLWDLGEFEQKEGKPTRWGTKEELLYASSIAKKYNIGTIVDAVLNHKLGADRTEVFSAVEVDPLNRNVEISPVRKIEGWTAFDFPGRRDQFSGLKWRHEHFTGLDWDQRTRSKGVFRITGQKRKGWSRRVDKELGNYDYLLGIDIDHRHRDVHNDFMSWGPWVLDTIGSNGFRLDAIKHMDRKFLLDFIRNAQRHGHKNLFAVAEYWSANYKKIEPYIRALQGQVSFFDVPLHHNFHEASEAGSNYDLRVIFDKTVVQKRPDDAVTFVDNHDTQVGQSLESWVDSSFKPHAYALILLRPGGYPCVFYGDLYPCDLYDPEVAQDYISSSRHRNCVGFTRLGWGPRRGCAVVLSNADPSGDSPEHTLSMSVGQENSNQRYRNLLGDSGEIITSPNGLGDFRCAPGQVAVWIRE